jgi:poly(ADP-ribose) glycohydrolase ARH3
MLSARLGKGTYTDDTEMMIAIAESLVECRGFVGANMAGKFLENFHTERGYGRGTCEALDLIRSGTSWKEAGERVFDGGSFGNGSAMRIAPVGVFYFDEPGTLCGVACQSSIITHAHVLGKEGAALQAGAISLAISAEPSKGIDPEKFVGDLLRCVSPGEVLHRKLEAVKGLLGCQPSQEEVISTLGHDSSAPGSVPTALYCFLAHRDSFEEAVVYAVNLGGDTDTIGAMTGAISGGYHGKTHIPVRWLRDLEGGRKGRDYIESLAIRLWEIKISVGDGTRRAPSA